MKSDFEGTYMMLIDYTNSIRAVEKIEISFWLGLKKQNNYFCHIMETKTKNSKRQIKEGQSDQRLLRRIVIERSFARTFQDARMEWYLKRIFVDYSKCVCGHRIKYNCVIRNRKTDYELIVGNTCVMQFDVPELRVESSIFKSLKSLRKAPEKNKASLSLLAIALQCHIITQSSFDWYRKVFHTKEQVIDRYGKMRTRSKRTTTKMRSIRTEINRRILDNFV